jgi:hypothetical protein
LDLTPALAKPRLVAMRATPQVTKIPCRHCDGLGYRLAFNPAWARQARKKAGLTLQDVAEAMGITAAYLSDMELGKKPFTQQMEDKFLLAVGDAR